MNTPVQEKNPLPKLHQKLFLIEGEVQLIQDTVNKNSLQL